MPQRRPAPVRTDILHLARDNPGTADQVIISGVLLNAALRATGSILLDDPRRKVVLSDAIDRIYFELTQATPAQFKRMPLAERRNASLPRVKHPVLRR